MATDQPPKTAPAKVLIYIDPGYVMLVGVMAGLIYGFLMVALDPWLRFPNIPLRLNWRDALLTASMMGAYASALGWILTSFWRSRWLWLVVLVSVPLLTALVMAWNDFNSAFGLPSDFLTFLPATAIFHAMALGLCWFYMQIILQFESRQLLVMTVLPVVLGIMVFLGVGRVRWSNPDAKDVMTAVNQYALGATQDGDYSLEFLSIRYREADAPTGSAIIHTEGGDLGCRVRLFPQGADISCQPQDD